ncbi:MAG: TonB-dependent receptor, partial [Bryobacteraceae bacterium]
FELIDHVSYIKGSHTLQFGGNYDRETKTQNNNNPNNNGSFAFDGSASGDALADILLGRVFQYTESSTHLSGTAMFHDFGWYAQDRWHPDPRLTLTYGVRYEFFQPERDTNGTMSYFDAGRFNFANAATVQTNGQIVPGTENFSNGIVVVGKDSPYGYALTNSVKNSFAPRVGLSYSATKDNLTVIRAGYGIFHDRWPVYASQARRNFPFNQSVSIFNTTLSNPAQGNLRVFPAAVINFSSPWDIPYLHKWSIGVQRQLPADFLIDVGYVGSEDCISLDHRHQPAKAKAIVASGQASPNAVDPSGFASISSYVTDGNTNYQSLQVSAVRVLWSFSVQSAYTWRRQWTT